MEQTSISGNCNTEENKTMENNEYVTEMAASKQSTIENSNMTTVRDETYHSEDDITNITADNETNTQKVPTSSVCQPKDYSSMKTATEERNKYQANADTVDMSVHIASEHNSRISKVNVITDSSEKISDEELNISKETNLSEDVPNDICNYTDDIISRNTVCPYNRTTDDRLNIGFISDSEDQKTQQNKDVEEQSNCFKVTDNSSSNINTFNSRELHNVASVSNLVDSAIRNNKSECSTSTSSENFTNERRESSIGTSESTENNHREEDSQSVRFVGAFSDDSLEGNVSEADIQGLVGELVEEIEGLSDEVEQLVELVGEVSHNNQEEEEGKEFYRPTPEVSSDEETTEEEEGLPDGDEAESGDGPDSMDRPLVLRRQTSFQRELADAIVRLAPLDELQSLLRCGASVSEPVTQGLTPLHYAVWQRYPQAAEMLISEGCDLNARDDIGYTPLHLCAEHGYIDMMQVLLRHKAKVNINQSEDADLYPIDAVDEPLRLALKHDQISAAKLLLENHADPNGRYFFGSEINLVSPLKPELLELLLGWGAKPNTRDRYGFTPIMKACHVQQEAEEQLEEMGTISGSDVLQHFAQTLRGIESVLVLISHGADINLRTDARHEYRSVLHYAILSGSSPIVNLLIKQGAKVNLEPEYNRASPLHLAVLKGDTGIINMLLDADAVINITTPTVGSPLHVACSELIPNRMDVLQLLLDRGADPNIVVRNEAGRPLKPPLGEYLANSPEHNVEVVKLMLRYGSQVVMQAPQRCPLGLLNCLYSVAKNREVMIELLEAAEKFDVPLIRKTPLLVHSIHRDLFLDIAVNPPPLRHLSRVFVRQIMKTRRPEAIEDLDLPRLLRQYLLYEIN